MTVKAISPERVQSNRLLKEWCGSITGVVLSIGSGGDIDKEGGRYRDYFVRASRYITSDVVGGCDLRLDVRDMHPLEDGEMDAVFCSGVLEHVNDIHSAVKEVFRVLRPGGVFIVGVPFKQPPHRVPQDYWRLTADGLRYLLKSFTIRDLRAIGDPAFPFAHWALAEKPRV